jgi:anti-sigma regulatory factor (Ser/Thr protein kinase)
MEVSPTHHSVPVGEAGHVSAVKIGARRAAEVAGFNADDVSRTGIVATELATNLAKHARGGEILMRGLRSPSAVEILAVDHGPGIRDVAASMSDGHSTTGTPGNGLGAIHRLTDDFDIYSLRDRGTVVVARLRAGRKSALRLGPLDVSGVSVAKHGEAICGDSWQVLHQPDGALTMVADGLGHGLRAGEASAAAIAAINPGQGTGLADRLRDVHARLLHTRGAAAGIAEVRPQSGTLRFAGIGNIAAAISRVGMTRHAVSLNGTLGHEARQFRDYSYPWDSDGLLVMHSDGLGSHWSIDDYPGLRQRHTATIAAVLYRDFNRHRDDVTVLVGRVS